MENESNLNERLAAANAMCCRIEDVQIINGIPEYRPIEPEMPIDWIQRLLQNGPLSDEP
jgi:hypothetical protein